MVFIHFICKRLGGGRPSREALAVEVVEGEGERGGGDGRERRGEDGLGQKGCQRMVRKKMMVREEHRLRETTERESRD